MGVWELCVVILGALRVGHDVCFAYWVLRVAPPEGKGVVHGRGARSGMCFANHWHFLGAWPHQSLVHGK